MRFANHPHTGRHVVFAATGVLGVSLLAACALHHPVPVTPDYPPEPPFESTSHARGGTTASDSGADQ